MNNNNLSLIIFMLLCCVNIDASGHEKLVHRNALIKTKYRVKHSPVFQAPPAVWTFVPQACAKYEDFENKEIYYRNLLRRSLDPIEQLNCSLKDGHLALEVENTLNKEISSFRELQNHQKQSVVSCVITLKFQA